MSDNGVTEELTEELNDIALHNIQFFIDEEKNPLLNNNFILRGNKFIENEDVSDNLDMIYSLADLVNPIYFTFHQSIDILNITENNSGLLASVLLSALEKVDEYYNECKDTNLHLESILNDIEFKLMYYQHKRRASICSRFMNHVSNKLYDFMMDCSREVFRHYYFNDFVSSDNDIDTDNDDDDEDNDDEDDEDNDNDSSSVSSHPEEENRNADQESDKEK